MAHFPDPPERDGRPAGVAVAPVGRDLGADVTSVTGAALTAVARGAQRHERAGGNLGLDAATQAKERSEDDGLWSGDRIVKALNRCHSPLLDIVIAHIESRIPA